MLDGSVGQSSREGSLLPDVLVVVIDAARVVARVRDAIGRLKALVLTDGRPLTLVSGPSATSDIELDRVEGMHGPRQLEIVLRA